MKDVEEYFAVGTIIVYNRMILLLKRSDRDRMQPGEWGLPAGRIEEGETALQAAVRETFEETGYRAKPEELRYVQDARWDSEEEIVNFSIFRLELKKEIKVRLNPAEHSEFIWIAIEKVKEIPNLIRGAYELLDEAFRKSC